MSVESRSFVDERADSSAAPAARAARAARALRTLSGAGSARDTAQQDVARAIARERRRLGPDAELEDEATTELEQWLALCEARAGRT